MTGARSDAGSLTDTYVAAIQHDLADLPPETTRVGVVRRPASWFHATVDENVPELAPPEALLDETKRLAEDFQRRGVCDEEAHNAAWSEADFAERYRAHVETAAEAQTAMTRLIERLYDGESIALVCFENTAKKRCHRTILRDLLSERLEATG